MKCKHGPPPLLKNQSLNTTKHATALPKNSKSSTPNLALITPTGNSLPTPQHTFSAYSRTDRKPSKMNSSNYTPVNKKYTAITSLYKKTPSVNPAGAAFLTRSAHPNNKQSSPPYATLTSPPKDEATDPPKSSHKKSSTPTQTDFMAHPAASSTSDSPATPRPKPPF